MKEPPRAGSRFARLLRLFDALRGRTSASGVRPGAPLRVPLGGHLGAHLGRFTSPLRLARAALARGSRRSDFSRLTTRESVQQWQRQGKLARVLLLPAMFGGMDAEANAAYVPPEVLPVQQRLLATLERYRIEGRIDTLTVAPEYKGRSLIPARIRVQAGKEGRVGAFTTVIGIW
jgi:hypothetical protein